MQRCRAYTGQDTNGFPHVAQTFRNSELAPNEVICKAGNDQRATTTSDGIQETAKILAVTELHNSVVTKLETPQLRGFSIADGVHNTMRHKGAKAFVNW